MTTQETRSNGSRDLSRHPVLRVVKVLTLIALGVIAVAFTVFFLRFTRNVAGKPPAQQQPPASTPQAPAQQ